MSIEKRSQPDHTIVRPDKPVVGDPEIKNCLEELKAQAGAHSVVIFDFAQAREVTVAALRALAQGVRFLTSAKIPVALVGKTEVERTVRELGLDRILPCHHSLEEIVPSQKSQPSERGSKGALEFLNTVLEAVVYTFDVSVHTKATAGKGFVRGNGTVPRSDIGAVIGLVSDPFTGSLVLAFSMDTYLKVISRMTMQEYTELTPDVRDGVAELLNIIFGEAKIVLNEKGFALKQAIPTVIQGTDVKISSSGRQSVVVPFESDIGTFYVELTTDSVAMSAAA